MNKYLVIARGEDEPHMRYMTKEEVIRELNDEWADYVTLTKEVSLEYFPERSLLIICGKICQKMPVAQVTHWTLKEDDRYIDY